MKEKQKNKSFVKKGIIAIIIMCALSALFQDPDQKKREPEKTKRKQEYKETSVERKRKFDISPILNSSIGRHEFKNNQIKLYFNGEFDDNAVIYTMQAAQYISRKTGEISSASGYSIDHPKKMLVKIVAKNSKPAKIEYADNTFSSNKKIEEKRIAFCKDLEKKFLKNKLKNIEYNKFYTQHVSGLDGSVRPAVRYIKNKLNDPSSFEHIESKIYTLSDRDGWYKVETKFLCKNAFGASVQNNVSLYINQNGDDVRTDYP